MKNWLQRASRFICKPPSLRTAPHRHFGRKDALEASLAAVLVFILYFIVAVHVGFLGAGLARRITQLILSVVLVSPFVAFSSMVCRSDGLNPIVLSRRWGFLHLTALVASIAAGAYGGSYVMFSGPVIWAAISYYRSRQGVGPIARGTQLLCLTVRSAFRRSTAPLSEPVSGDPSWLQCTVAAVAIAAVTWS